MSSAFPDVKVRVTPEQFSRLRELEDRFHNSAISSGDYIAQCMDVCPDLKMFQNNLLEVASA